MRTEQGGKRGGIMCLGGPVDPALDGNVTAKCALLPPHTHPVHGAQGVLRKLSNPSLGVLAHSYYIALKNHYSQTYYE